LTHNLSVEALLAPLLPLYQRERAAGRAFALAIVVQTRGSTYRKAGALMAIAADDSYAGLLSGGCLESDLREHARQVIETGAARTVSYDTGGSDDLIWGLGVGCEGAMQILLLRVGPETDWQPLEHLAAALAAHTPTAIAVLVEASDTHPSGTLLLPQSALLEELAGRAQLEAVVRSGQAGFLGGSGRVFAVPLALPPSLLLLGGGPDALPLADFAARLAWRVTVYDHRPAYARAEQFPQGTHVVLADVDALARRLDLARYQAAVVMSHHLPSDLEYLRALAASPIAYVGLLGPPHRRERLLQDLGPSAAPLQSRLHAPVGLDLGGRAPESIALSIVAEIHAYLHQRAGGPFNEHLPEASTVRTRHELLQT
jgi:xanthine dehydrogenase accessory factor